MNHWLLKSEPAVFSIDDLAREKGKRTEWEGVRNYQARNMLRDQMNKGDLAFFYHSNAPETGIAGIVEIVREGYPDPHALDPDSPYYDDKSDPQRPRWYVVDVKLKRKLKRVITLQELKAEPRLADMQLLKKGNRLSVMPVAEKHWKHILSLE